MDRKREKKHKRAYETEQNHANCAAIYHCEKSSHNTSVQSVIPSRNEVTANFLGFNADTRTNLSNTIYIS